MHPILANGEVKFFLFPSDYINVLHFIYYVHLPQPVGKDKYTFVHLLKEFPYPVLDALPINTIHYITHMPSFYFVINSYANTPSAQYICKNTKNIQKCDYRDGFGLQGELDLTLFLIYRSIEGQLGGDASVMLNHNGSTTSSLFMTIIT